MVSQNIWNNVTLISASEFARTLSSNGEGTDHAWGGNHFIIGGSVKGGRVHGQYPSDLTENGNLNIGQGRLIPTTPWEGVWNGLAEWFGVTSDNMSQVIPNKANFGGVNIFSKAVMFD
jgi:cullin-associated NEDD8-dissociated protein 1